MPKIHTATSGQSLAEKGWDRADMPAWEARWAALPEPERALFLSRFEVAPAHYVRPALNPVKRFPESSLRLWRQAGLIADHDGTRVVVAPEARGFLTRLTTLHQAHLLEPDSANRLPQYLNGGFDTYQLGQVIAGVVEHATGIGKYAFQNEPISTFVVRRAWPDWVADYLPDPVAKPLLEAFEKAGKPMPLARVAGLLPEQHPSAVRQALDLLLMHLALVEGIDAKTGELLVGLLPAVAKLRRQKEAEPAELKPAVAKEVGPEGGLTVPDLRAFLLEVATLPPRLKQDGSLFQKEEARFLQSFDPVPDWFLSTEGAEGDYARLHSAHRWAVRMAFVDSPSRRSENKLLRLNDAGQRWLTLDRESQFAALAEFLREGTDGIMYWGWNDHTFLASSLTATAVRKGARQPHSLGYGEMPKEEKQPLRDALHQLFAELPVGAFYRAADVVRWGTEPARNPLLLRRPMREVVVRMGHRQLPPLEEALADAGRRMLDDFIGHRLLSMGCLQAGVDADGKLLVARLPRLDAYFGKAVVGAPAAPAAETRVLVQPDFTVVVIGLDAAPAAELAPFCDRQRGSASHGSLTFRLSRESVLRGIAEGIAAEEMLERLQRLASKKVPDNVVTEVRAWAGQVRRVTVRSAILFDCPDASTAGRVQQLLGKRAERVGDTGVAWPADEKLTGSLRKKLQEQGIFVEGGAKPKVGRPKKRR